MTAESPIPAPGTNPGTEAAELEQPMKIQLDEAPKAAPSAPVNPYLGDRIEGLPPIPAYGEDEESEIPSKLASAKKFVARGYFDPFSAFGHRVDWRKFTKAQTFLFLISLVLPFLYLLGMGTLVAILYLFGASIASATTPNPIHELALYPLVFVLAKGYWIAYLALPIAVFILGWIWAALTAWNLTRDADPRVIDFKKALSILAMLGAMLAPFTLFPFLRLVALSIIFWYLFKRMHETFNIPIGQLLRRGGLSLVGVTFAYSWCEREAESYFPAQTELASNLDSFYRKGKKLEWPEFGTKVMPPSPSLLLLQELGDFDQPSRERAAAKALTILKGGGESPEMRYRLASRMAEMGNPEGMAFVARFQQAGTGTPVNLPSALEWMHKAALANPKQLDLGLEEAKLLIQNQRVLEGKHLYVALAKDNIESLRKISDFIQTAGLGKVDTAYQHQIQNLYMYGSCDWDSSSEEESRSRGRRYHQPSLPSEKRLAQDLASRDKEGNQWFYRALVDEFGKSVPADAEVYGESSTAIKEEELARKVASGDPVALDVEGDRSYQRGDVSRARDFWLKASLSLNSDDRVRNAPFYLKLAESYDPSTAQKAPDAHLAVKYYLGCLLVTSSQDQPSPRLVAALKRLGTSIGQDTQAQPFLELCLRHDLPEAWATMGSRCLNGDNSGVPLNRAKARDCFLKAQSLGYNSPSVYKVLTDLDPANAAKWKSLAKGNDRGNGQS